MSIREDEKLQRLENKKYLTELIQQYFKGKYESLNKIYQDKANMVLIDSEEIEGLIKFYKDEFEKLDNRFLFVPTNAHNVKPRPFESIGITDNKFNYSKDEILERSKDLSNITFPNLKETLTNGKPFSYLNLFITLDTTTGKVFLKHKLENLKTENNPKFDPNNIWPFREFEYFECFETYVNRKHIIEPYIDYSYIFQRLKHHNLIEKIEHLEFSEWLFKKGFISNKVREKILIEKGFRSLDKSSTINRENNFNTIFGF